MSIPKHPSPHNKHGGNAGRGSLVALPPAFYTLKLDNPTPVVVGNLLQALARAVPDHLFLGPDERLVGRKPNGLHLYQAAELQSLADAHVTAVPANGVQKPVPSRFINTALHPRPHEVLRELHRIVGLPSLVRDDTGRIVLHSCRGYEPTTLAWHDFPTPSAPGTRADYEWLLELVLGGYYFATSLDRWIAEAALITPLFRPLVLWVPAFLIWGERAGVGKTILAQFIGRVQLGYAPHVEPVGTKEWELNYAIGAAFQFSGPTGIVLLDNLVAHENFDSPALAAILTARACVRTPRLPKFASGIWVDPASVTVFATGICPYLGPELRRRFLPICLLPNPAGSWSRTPDQIEKELDENRARVVAALLWAAGHILPPTFKLHPVEIPSYVEWGRVAGGLLMALHPSEADEIEGAWATLPDMLLRRQSNEQDVALLRLLEAVPEDTPGIRPFMRPSQLLERLEGEPACAHLRTPLAQLLSAGTRRAQQTRLGLLLHGLVTDRVVFDRIGVEERPHRKGGNEYRAVIVPPSRTGGAS